ncbi:MAG: lysophospholipid acyltransferase family protein [Verrucomicrobiota bacterium]
MSDLSYRLGQAFFWTFLRGMSHVIVEGAEHLPASGPVLVMTNHFSHFDPLLVGSTLRRPVDFMADKPLLEIPVAGRLLASWNAFPIDRTKPDRATVRTALERLKAGRVVGIFPEGGVRHGAASMLRGATLPEGTVNLWRLVRCPALVGAIIGTDQLYQWRSAFRRTRVFIRYRPVLPAPERGEEPDAIRERLENAIREAAREIEERHGVRPEEQSRSAQVRWAEK